MKPILLFFENHSKKIEIIFGIIGIFSSVSGFIWKWLNVSVFIAIFMLLTFLVIRYFTRKNQNNLSKGKIIFLNILAFSFLVSTVIPLYFSFIKPTIKCTQSNNKIGVLITKFTDEKSDDFSYSLTNNISELINDNNSAAIAFIDTFLNQNYNINPEKSGELITENCFNKGIVIFGKRSEDSKLFDCTIYISNNLKTDYTEKELGDNRVIRLKNPDLIEFSIDNQSIVVAELIIAILDFYNQQYSSASEKLGKLESSGLLREHKELLKLCKLYKANAYLGNGELNSSAATYKEVVFSHPNLPIANYNYAMLNLAEGDSSTAQTFFEIAKSLDYNLTNPLEGISFEQIRSTNNDVHNANNNNSKETSIAELNISTSKEEITFAAPAANKQEIPNSEATIDVNKNKFYYENCFSTKICVFDSKGKRTGIYDYLYPVEKPVNGESFYYVMKEGNWGIIDNYGRLIIPPRHESPKEALKSLSPFLQ